MATQKAAVQQESALTIADMAERTNLSTDTLRYYEKVGLIDTVGRTTGNQRRYASADVAWIEFLLRLRETGMSIADMVHFARLRAGGDRTIPARIELLRSHAEGLAERIRSLQQNAAALELKITHYEKLAHDK